MLRIVVQMHWADSFWPQPAMQDFDFCPPLLRAADMARSGGITPREAPNGGANASALRTVTPTLTRHPNALSWAGVRINKKRVSP